MSSLERPRAAFFDLDKTLVRVNTGKLYVRWRYREKKLGLRQLLFALWWSARYTFGLLDAEEISRRVVRTLEGEEEAQMIAECEAWFRREIRQHITDRARREVERRQKRGEICAILSASSPYVTRPVARELGIDHVICSRLTVREGRFTGELEEPLCYGQGKVHWAKRWAEERGLGIEQSAFYTDSISDLPMLEAVREPRVVNPDPRLRAAAWRRGWKIEEWE